MPQDHPLRRVLPIVDAALADLSGEFAKLYAPIGRPSIPPEKLLRALLLQAFYSVRSARQLIEQLTYNLLFRWFVGLAIDDPLWDVTVFTKNRDRLLDGAIAAKFFQAVLSQPQVKALLSDEHFTVDGTLIEAFASLKSFRPRAGPGAEPPAGGGRNAERDFHGERRRNATHASTTDPEARLLRKGRGKEAKLGFMGHLLMENRHGLIVDALVSEASGTAERAAALTHARPPGAGATGSRSAPTRPTTWRTSWPICARSRSPRTSRRTSPTGVRRSMAGPRATRATRSASGCGRGSRRPSAGSRRSADCARPATAAPHGSAGCSPDRGGLQPDPPAQAAGGG